MGEGGRRIANRQRVSKQKLNKLLITSWHSIMEAEQNRAKWQTMTSKNYLCHLISLGKRTILISANHESFEKKTDRMKASK